MDSALHTVHLDIPQSDLSFFKELAKKMGWKMTVSTNKDEKIQTDAKRDIMNDRLLASEKKCRHVKMTDEEMDMALADEASFDECKQSILSEY